MSSNLNILSSRLQVNHMATVTFDTHKFIRRLKESGIDEKQAEAIVEGFSEAQSEGKPVTNDYLDTKLFLIKEQLTLEIEKTRSDTIKWDAGLLIAQGVLIATFVKLFSLF